MYLALLLALATLLLALVLTPMARELAVRFDVHDSPNHRKIHKRSTPKFGGLSVFAAFALGGMGLAWFGGETPHLWGLLAASGCVVLVGLLDDVVNLNCYHKLLGQVLAAVVAVYFGFRVDSLYWAADASVALGLWAWPLSVLWIVGLTNALNLLDGLDGLAAGFAVIAAAFILLGAGLLLNYEMVVLTLILIAAITGFLKYNLNPARIFLGDTGSLFLGFVLACLSLQAFTLPYGDCLAGVPVVLFLVPLADTGLAIFRRLSHGRHPFWADRKHIHHRLLELGVSQNTAVFAIHAAAFLCGTTATLLLFLTPGRALLLTALLVVLLFLGLLFLGCFDFLVLSARRKSRHFPNRAAAQRPELPRVSHQTK